MSLDQDIGSVIYSNNSYTNSLPLGNGTIIVNLNSMGAVIDPANSNINFPDLATSKIYLVELMWSGAQPRSLPPLLLILESHQFQQPLSELRQILMHLPVRELSVLD